MKAFSAAPVFHVRDLEASLRFYTDVLGFTEEFRFGEYAGVCRDGVSLHLSAHSAHRKPPGSGHVYIFCDSVDEFYRTVVERGAKTLAEPKDYPYGMRDFELEDPDGNYLAFGAEVAEG